MRRFGYVGLALLVACTSGTLRFKLALEDMRRPGIVAHQFGPATISAADGTYLAEDRAVKVALRPTEDGFDLRLTNKTDHMLRVFWSGAAFIDRDGTRSSLMRGIGTMIDPAASNDVTFLDAGQTIADHIVSRSAHAPTSSKAGPIGWRHQPMFTSPDTGKDSREAAKRLIGQTYSIMLPLEIDGMVHDYRFMFRITDVTHD
jgi:hypothetical protein